MRLMRFSVLDRMRRVGRLLRLDRATCFASGSEKGET